MSEKAVEPSKRMAVTLRRWPSRMRKRTTPERLELVLVDADLGEVVPLLAVEVLDAPGGAVDLETVDGGADEQVDLFADLLVAQSPVAGDLDVDDDGAFDEAEGDVDRAVGEELDEDLDAGEEGEAVESSDVVVDGVESEGGAGVGADVVEGLLAGGTGDGFGGAVVGGLDEQHVVDDASLVDAQVVLGLGSGLGRRLSVLGVRTWQWRPEHGQAEGAECHGACPAGARSVRAGGADVRA